MTRKPRQKHGSDLQEVAMKSIMVLLVILACGCAQQAYDASRDVATRVFTLTGLTIEAPPDSGWVLRNADRGEAAFQRHGAHSSGNLVAQVLTTDPFVDDQSFLQFAEERREAAVSAVQMLSIHFNRTRFKGAACLQYDGVFRDTLATGSEREFLNMQGYLCRHPTLARQAVQLEFTQYSASRTPPDMEQELETAAAFFKSAVFADSGAPR